MGGEPGPCASHPGDHLVEADQEPVVLPPLVQAAPESLRWRVSGQRCRAHGLAEEGCDRLRPGFVQEGVKLPERSLAARIEPPRRWLEVQMVRQVRGVRLLERAASAQRERSHRGPVVGLRGRDHPPAVRLAPLHVVQPCELQGRFVRLGTTGHEPDPRHLRRRDLQQSVGQTLLRLAREVVVVEVRDRAGLLRSRRDDLRHAMPQTRDHGAARASVEDAPTVGGAQPHPSATFDVRVRKVEEPWEHLGVLGADRSGHRPPHRCPSPHPRAARDRPGWSCATSRRNQSRSRDDIRLLSTARRFVSSSSASGSTPSASSS